MGSKILFWRVLKILNLNKFFRKNLKTLRYIGKVYFRRTIWHQHWFEAVRIEGFNNETNKVVVRKVINKGQTAEVEPEQLFLNAYR